MRWWVIEIKGWPWTIIEAKTRSKARYLAFLRLRDIGYKIPLVAINVTSDTCKLRRGARGTE